MKYQLYGDGIHDDTLAIQELLDSGRSEIVLDAPVKNYLISKTLKIHGGQTLRMSPTTVIRLMDDSNCCMLEDDCFTTFKENICVDGGIWDYNNVGQEPNPFRFKGKDGLDFFERKGKTRETFSFVGNQSFLDGYTGKIMRFCRIRRFTLKNVTLKNPVTYGVDLAFIEDFTIRDIYFDYKLCNPKYWNMDGVHLEGGCKNGYIFNLQGACHDDMLAITADDLIYAPIENIVADGIIAEHCKSAVRLLSHGEKIKNVHIKNIFGSYYSFCVGITKYHGGPEERGKMYNISIENIFASACEGTADVKGGIRPFILVQSGLDIDGLSIEHVYREETKYPTPLFKMEETAVVNRLYMSDIVQKSQLDVPIPFIDIEGEAEGAIIERAYNM